MPSAQVKQMPAKCRHSLLILNLLGNVTAFLVQVSKCLEPMHMLELLPLIELFVTSVMFITIYKGGIGERFLIWEDPDSDPDLEPDTSADHTVPIQ